MKQHSERETLEDILNAYVASTSAPSHASLAEWIRLYPQYERELTEFTVSWSVIESLPPSKSEDVDEDTLVLRGMSIVQNILHEHKQAQQSRDKAAIDGILKEGTFHGLSIQQIAERSQLSLVLVRKLDRRLTIMNPLPLPAICKVDQLSHLGQVIVPNKHPELPSRKTSLKPCAVIQR